VTSQKLIDAAGYSAGAVGKLLITHGMADHNVLFLNSTKLFHKL
jgi:hypothetical protein